MVKQQQTLILSPYMHIYDLVISKNNLLRQINELIDFYFFHLLKACGDGGIDDEMWFSGVKRIVRP